MARLNAEFMRALNEIAEQKGIDKEIVLEALERSRKSSWDKNGPSLAASTMASAAFSPSPSMLLKEGMILPSMIWKLRECALNRSIGINSKPRAYISCTSFISLIVACSFCVKVSERRL